MIKSYVSEHDSIMCSTNKLNPRI